MICGETRKRGGTRGTRSRGRVVPHRGRTNDVSHPATVGIAFSQEPSRAAREERDFKKQRRVRHRQFVVRARCRHLLPSPAFPVQCRRAAETPKAGALSLASVSSTSPFVSRSPPSSPLSSLSSFSPPPSPASSVVAAACINGRGKVYGPCVRSW